MNSEPDSKVLIIGITRLVANNLLNLLLENKEIDTVHIFVTNKN
jgi:hypothetical protein